MIFLKQVHVDKQSASADYPFNIPSIAALDKLTLSSSVVFFVGENGSGKSTLLEALGQEVGFNISGGNKNHTYSVSAQSTSPLGEYLRLSWMPKTHKGFYMRAESLFNFASYIDELAYDDPSILSAYGGDSLHSQSHGESFLSLFQSRFKEGLFLMDEPEAALSPVRQLSLLKIMKDHDAKAQFIIATHSPILLSYPGAQILLFNEDGLHSVTYEEVPHVQLYKQFLDNPQRYLNYLFED